MSHSHDGRSVLKKSDALYLIVNGKGAFPVISWACCRRVSQDHRLARHLFSQALT